MNKLLLLLFLMPLVYSTAIYSVDVDRSGFTSITFSTDAGQEAMITLPADAWNFRIVGGSYSLQNDSAIITPGQSGFTTFSYTSRMLTTKSGSGWILSFISPADSITWITMPSYSTLESSVPQPKSVTAEDSRTLIEMESEAVNLHYRLEETAEPVAQSDFDGSFLLAAAIVVVAAFLLMHRNTLFKVSQAPSLDMTPGKKEMMETFNENDLRVVNYLLSNNGKSRRNELERKSGISKSSLASSLNRLEKRKIIEIDRTATTHFVKLSDYFLKL